MKKRYRAGLFDFATAPLVVIMSGIGWLYRVFFTNSDIRLSKRSEELLAEKIRANLWFLFSDWNAKLTSEEGVKYPRPLDYAVVVVTVRNVRMRFTSGRGDLRIQIAPITSPNDWTELNYVLESLGSEYQGNFSTFDEVATVFKTELPRLEFAFSPERLTGTNTQLITIKEHAEAVRRQWQNEINRRLHEK